MYMKTILTFALLLLVSTKLFAAQKPKLTLCKNGESTVFNCQVKGKTLSVCASKSNSAKDKFMQYRFGSPSKLELSIPEKGIEGVKVGNLMYSGGGGEFISFSNKDTEYVIFSRIMKGGEDSGVLVQKGGKKIAGLNCKPNSQIEMTMDEVASYGIPTNEKDDYDF